MARIVEGVAISRRRRDPPLPMTNWIRTLAVALVIAPALAEAQVAVDIRIGFPAPPPLVVVSPGVQVVPDYEEEVFFSGGWYWLRRDAAWYRTRDHRGGWALVEPRLVPASLVGLPPGHYKHWRKEQAKAEKRAFKEHEKAHKKAGKGKH
jgi:hypothetical protein